MINGLGNRYGPAIKTKNADLVWRKKPLYDTLITAAGGAGLATVPFFVVPRQTIGSGFVVAKTECETNLSAVGQISEGDQFLLNGFVVEPLLVNAGAVAAFLAIYQTGVFRFITGQNTVQLEVPLDRIPSGPGAIGGAAVTVGGAPLSMASIHNGVPHISQVYDFRTPEGIDEAGNKVESGPVVIDGGDSFRCEIVYAGVNGPLITAAATRIRCYMMGLYGEKR